MPMTGNVGGGGGGGPDAGAISASRNQDANQQFQQQVQSDNATNQMSAASNMESKWNQCIAGIIANLK